MQYVYGAASSFGPIWVSNGQEFLKIFIVIFSVVSSNRSKAQPKPLQKLHQKHAKRVCMQYLFQVEFVFRKIPL